jgi:putative ABC transport system substrate-binding protein
LGLTLQLLELRTSSDVDGALAAVKRESAEALIVVRNPLTVTHAAKIADFAAANRLPAMYGDREFIRPGGLMSYGVSIPELWGRAAVYVDKILKGAAPATLPVERPTKFELVINMKAAKAAGLSIAPAVLARADQVVQ